MYLLDLAAPVQILAHQSLAEQVKVHYISTSSQQYAQQGLQLAQLTLLPCTFPTRAWLLLIGSSNLYQRLNEPEYQQAIAWLSQYQQHFELIAGICSGTLIAAKAGLLNHKRCTTHHELTSTLQQLAPLARVQEDCIFVNDGKVWTSAGITTGLDLCLQLVSQHWGYDKTLKIARDLVLYQRRSGHESQLSFWLQHRNHLQSRIHKVQDLIMANPKATWTVASLAAEVYLSERHLQRLFSQATGFSVQHYLQQARLVLAQQLLSQTPLSLERIAEHCGFQTERSLRRVWQRWLSGTPASYRHSKHKLTTS